MITGIYRVGRTVMNVIEFIPWAFTDQHDIKALILFGGNIMTNINMDNAFAKYGQFQIEYNSMKQLWYEGKYAQAGETAAEGLVNLAEYHIPQLPREETHVWPWNMMQPIGYIDSEQKAADLISGLMIGLIQIDNYDNLTACMEKPADDFVKHISKVLTLLETRSNENLAKAVQKLGDTIYTLPDMLSNCEKSKDDIDALT